MDDETLTAAFHAHKESSTKFTRRMAINMADFFGVSVRELVLRLEQIGLLKAGAWEWFRRNGGFTREHFEIVQAERFNDYTRAEFDP